MTRNTKGIIGWSIITTLLIILYSFIDNGAQAVMVPIGICFIANLIREYWQYKTGRAKFFELDDIFRYSLTITTAAVISGMIFALLGILE